MIKKLFDRLVLTDEDKSEIRSFYNCYHKDGIEPLTEEAYNEFRILGRRIGYETMYFDRRRRIDGCIMMYKAYGDEYLAELLDLLWAVCDESTWALPAHTLNSEKPREEIDLFSAETAQMLTEIAYILKDKLPLQLHEKIRYEVRTRVIEVFERRSFGWEKAAHNWSAVCGGCIGMVYLYNNLTVPQRIFDALNCYLSGINDDGVCLEGIGYWCYGFGYYTYFAALLKERTGKDIMSSDKVYAAAHFGQNAYLGESVISCSDCMSDFAPPSGLFGVLNSCFDGIYMPAAEPVRYDDCGRWADYIRSYLYPRPRSRAETGEFMYPLSQWYINKKSAYSFFIKGGTNAEPHNHNDIGSFIITDNTRQLICDVGCGEYTDKYFNDNTRYDYICNSSLGHSVPIIDGRAQSHGGGYRASDFSCGSGYVSMDIGAAYGNEISIKRHISLSDNTVTLRDTFKTDCDPVERFVSKTEPKVLGDKIFIGKLCMRAPDNVTKTRYSNHFGIDEDIYLLDFNVKGTEFELEFIIE